MKVTILKDGLRAKSEFGAIYKIKSLIIRAKNSSVHKYPDRIYYPGDNIFKAILAPGTIHQAEPLGRRSINVI